MCNKLYAPHNTTFVLYIRTVSTLLKKSDYYVSQHQLKAFVICCSQRQQSQTHYAKQKKKTPSTVAVSEVYFLLKSAILTFG